MMNVRVSASIGLLAIAVLHALLVGMTSQSNPCECEKPIGPRYVQVDPNEDPALPRITSTPVNTAALSETKQGIGAGLTENKTQGLRSQAAPCMPCQRPYYYVQPNYVQPNYVQPYYQPARPSYVQPYYYNTPAPPNYVQTRQASKPLKLALFVNGSPRSNEVLQWFSRDPELAGLRNSCEFQIYTPNDTLYRTKYASIVPAAAMPAVLWSNQPDGDVHQTAAAQIYAAGGDLFPVSSRQLVSDMRTAWGLYEQVKQAPVTLAMSGSSAVPPTGIRWEQFATPTLLLNQASSDPNCPDGRCPDGNRPDGHFPGDDSSPSSSPWARPFRQPQGGLLGHAAKDLEPMIALVILGAAVVFLVVKYRNK